jgi:glucokinase
MAKKRDDDEDDDFDYRKSGRKGLILGIELGRTKILSAVVNPYNKILSRAKRSTPVASSERLMTDDIIGCAEDALKRANVTDKDIIAIGLGSPGPLNPETGVIIRTGHAALRNYPIGQILAKHFGVPVTLDTNVHMSVYGEFRAGAAWGCRNVVGLWIASGVGGCVIRDGEVVLGANRNAGEIGHVILDASLRLEEGGRGTLATESSKTAIHNFIKRAVKKGSKTRLKKYGKEDSDRLKAGDLAKAFGKGDKVAVAAVEHSALYCGIAVANLFNILSPELFILGGNVVVNLGDEYIKLVRKTANRFVYSTDLAPVRIARARLGDDAPALGAAIAARDRL